MLPTSASSTSKSASSAAVAASSCARVTLSDRRASSELETGLRTGEQGVQAGAARQLGLERLHRLRGRVVQVGGALLRSQLLDLAPQGRLVDLATCLGDGVALLRDAPHLGDGRIDPLTDVGEVVAQRTFGRGVDAVAEPALAPERGLDELPPRLVDRERIDPRAGGRSLRKGEERPGAVADDAEQQPGRSQPDETDDGPDHQQDEREGRAERPGQRWGHGGRAAVGGHDGAAQRSITAAGDTTRR